MNEYIKKSLYSLKDLLKFKSVKEEPYKEYPFGIEIGKSLEYFLNLAKNMGFETVNYDNYIGEVIFGNGEDENGFAILAHLDVVPEGDINLWKYSPFDLTYDNGNLYGRGVLDDKGPAIMCLYVLKELKDSGFTPSRKIKLILGCDEESGWDCIEHYKKVAVFPKEGVSPDGDFPVIYAEKGIYHVEYVFNVGKNVEDIFGGDRVNMVCDKTTVKLKNIEKYREKVNIFGGIINNNEVTFTGVTAHGSTPDKGVNAIKKALEFLVDIGEFSETDKNNLFYNKTEILNIFDETGNLTFSPNVIEYKENKVYIKTDIRYPSLQNFNFIKEELKKIGTYTEIRHQKPLYADKNGKLVTTLLNIYNEKTKDTAEAIAIGGGTYARALENGVAFGISFGDDYAHIPNEKQSLKNYELCYDIYKETIKRLC